MGVTIVDQGSHMAFKKRIITIIVLSMTPYFFFLCIIKIFSLTLEMYK